MMMYEYDDIDLAMVIRNTQKRNTEVLSQDEIDQLLTAINAGDTEPEEFSPVNRSGRIKEVKRSKNIEYKFDALSKVSEDAANEMVMNFTILQKEFIESRVKDVVNKVDQLEKKVKSLSEENLRLEKIVRSAELFD